MQCCVIPSPPPPSTRTSRGLWLCQHASPAYTRQAGRLHWARSPIPLARTEALCIASSGSPLRVAIACALCEAPLAKTPLPKAKINPGTAWLLPEVLSRLARVRATRTWGGHMRRGELGVGCNARFGARGAGTETTASNTSPPEQLRTEDTHTACQRQSWRELEARRGPCDVTWRAGLEECVGGAGGRPCALPRSRPLCCGVLVEFVARLSRLLKKASCRTWRGSGRAEGG